MIVIFAPMNTENQHLAWFQSAESSVSSAYVPVPSLLAIFEQHSRTSCGSIEVSNLLAIAGHALWREGTA
jgi:hypothetical protein